MESLILDSHASFPIDPSFFGRSICPDRLVELDLGMAQLYPDSLRDFFLPRCTTLKALRLEVPREAPSNCLTLQSLTYLEIQTWDEQGPTVIAHAPNLIHLTLDGDWNMLESWPTMPELRILTLYCHSSLPRMEDLPPTIVDLRIFGGTSDETALPAILTQLSDSHKNGVVGTGYLIHLEHLRVRIKYEAEEDLRSPLRSILLERTSLHLQLVLRDYGLDYIRDLRHDLRREFGERVELDDAWPPTCEPLIFNNRLY